MEIYHGDIEALRLKRKEPKGGFSEEREMFIDKIREKQERENPAYMRWYVFSLLILAVVSIIITAVALYI